MEIVDRIKFDAPSDEVLVWKHPSDNLRLGSQLVVHQTQEAVFVLRGQILDFFGPGTHTLSTGNIPLLGKLVNLPFDNKTPFTAEVWFISKTVKRDLRWGTLAPVPLIDPAYQYPISARAFGRWGLRITESRPFVVHIVGTLGATSTQRIQEYFIGEIHQNFSVVLARFISERKISIFDINSKLDELSEASSLLIQPILERYGIALVNFNVERVGIPENELTRFQEVLGRRMEADQLSQAQITEAYKTIRTFDTLEKAAENESGAAGALIAGGLGLGVGVSAGYPLGQRIAGAVGGSVGEGAPPHALKDRLRALKEMLDEDLITEDEFQTKRRSLLDAL